MQYEAILKHFEYWETLMIYICDFFFLHIACENNFQPKFVFISRQRESCSCTRVFLSFFSWLSKPFQVESFLSFHFHRLALLTLPGSEMAPSEGAVETPECWQRAVTGGLVKQRSSESWTDMREQSSESYQLLVRRNRLSSGFRTRRQFSDSRFSNPIKG